MNAFGPIVFTTIKQVVHCIAVHFVDISYLVYSISRNNWVSLYNYVCLSAHDYLVGADSYAHYQHRLNVEAKATTGVFSIFCLLRFSAGLRTIEMFVQI